MTVFLRLLRNSVSLGLLLMLTAFAGCNVGGSSGDDQVARFRILHAAPDANALDVLIDSLVVLSGVSFGESSGYFSVDEGERVISVNQSGSAVNLIEVAPTLRDGTDYTFLIVNYLNQIESLLIEDRNVEPDFGETKLRFIHAAPGSDNLDIYVTDQNDDIAVADAEFSLVPFKGITEYLGRDEGEYRIRVTPAGSKVPLVDTGAIRFDAGDIRTLVITDAPGGGAPFRAILLEDSNQ